MDADEARAAMIKATRRELMAALNVMYHIGPLGFEAICAALLHLQLPDDDCVKRDLTYLVDNGDVKWTNEANQQRWKNRLYKLTPQGKRKADKIDRDPTLEP